MQCGDIGTWPNGEALGYLNVQDDLQCERLVSAQFDNEVSTLLFIPSLVT